MFGVLNNQEIEEMLSAHVFGHLGCHADDTTYVVPVSYAYDGEYIYGHTEEGMKISMMRKNPKVCFQLEHMENMANWKSVIAWGEYEEVQAPAERQAALTKFLERELPSVSSNSLRQSPQWPFMPDDKSTVKGIVFRIKLHKKTGRFERTGESSFSR